VVRRHLVPLGALLVEPQPPALGRQARFLSRFT